jgi:Mrp family chromosome partitioning ATPase
MQETQNEALRQKMGGIKHKLVVLSGKGGVGKSTAAVNLAVSLTREGYKTGLLDADIHGPSVPDMLGLQNQAIQGREGELYPVFYEDLKVVSIGFLLKDADDAVIWRGPVKAGVIRQFLTDVVWGELDYLVIDSPPGTGDEPLTVCQLTENLDGALIVTTPQRIAAVDVRKSVTFCGKVNVPVLGIVENMSGFRCPGCGKEVPLFGSGAGKAIAADMEVPYLGSIPFDPAVGTAADQGCAYFLENAGSWAAEKMGEIIKKITGRTEEKERN